MNTPKPTRALALLALPVVLLLTACTAGGSGTTQLQPGESIAWTLEGPKIEFKAKNQGPGDITITRPNEDPVDLAPNSSVSSSYSTNDTPHVATIEIENSSDQHTVVKWSYKARAADRTQTEQSLDR
ncbi:MAG: hypothetical protein AAF297_09470 [Planctomycetota bacterium]